MTPQEAGRRGGLKSVQARRQARARTLLHRFQAACVAQGVVPSEPILRAMFAVWGEAYDTAWRSAWRKYARQLDAMGVRGRQAV